MNHRCLIIICLLIPFLATASKPVNFYFNSEWRPCTEENAAYVRTFTEEIDKYADNYMVEAFTISGKLLMTGHVSNIKFNKRNAYESQRNGMFVYYNEDGTKRKEGVYQKGVSVGKWMMYLPGPVKYVEEDYYSLGSLDSCRSINEKTGQLISVSYPARQDKALKSMSFEYFANGKVKKMYMHDGKKTTRQCMDETGAVIPCDTIVADPDSSLVEVLPVPAFDLVKFLGENVTYPEAARLAGKHGRCLISFIVMEDGSLNGIKPINTICPEIDEEAMRVISLMPKWQSGKQNGKTVKVLYTQPLSFKLE